MTDRPKRETAVALSYRPDQGDEAPRVVASGKGDLARQILDLAFAAGVKVREDADLVEILAAVDVDSPVPLEALMAVAEILTYVYLANGRMPGAAP
jgi:flagellar biosynthesis protein